MSRCKALDQHRAKRGDAGPAGDKQELVLTQLAWKTERAEWTLEIERRANSRQLKMRVWAATVFELE